MGRRYRRGSSVGSVISDTIRAAKRMSPAGAIVLGLVGFIIFYVGVPSFIEAQYSGQEGSRLVVAFSQLFAFRVHWFERLGIAVFVACALVATWNYYRLGPMGANERGVIGFLSKLASRNID